MTPLQKFRLVFRPWVRKIYSPYGGYFAAYTWPDHLFWKISEKIYFGNS